MKRTNRPQYLVSTDSIGFLGTESQLIQLWLEHFKNGTLDGVEVIAFKPVSRLKRIADLLKRNGIPIISFHGKTGGEDLFKLKSRIMMTLVNYFVEDIETIINVYPEVEFLSHGPYFGTERVRRFIFKKHPKTIWIENHLSGKKGVENAMNEIRFYRKHDINALGMMDIYHYVADMDTENIKKNWTNKVNEIKKYILTTDERGKTLFQGIHFPIGTREDDSLPIDQLTDKMLSYFSDEIIPHIDRVVFENQQKWPGLLISNQKMIIEQINRNNRIIARLKKTGIIK